MNLQKSIRKILREETNSVDQKTTQTELVKFMGPSNIKKGNRIDIVNRIMSFGSNIDIIVDYLDQETLDKINNFMSQKGWFPHSIGLSDMKQHKYSQKLKNYIGENDVQIGYESNFGNEIKINKTKAFHVTPDIFIDNIKKTGLTLKSESKLSDHPDRIYLFLNPDRDIPKQMVTTLWNSLSKERQATIKDYYVLEVDLTQIPNHKFYLDSQSLITFEAIYTTQPIPKSAIKVIDKIKTSGIKSYNDEVVMTPEDEKQAREEKKRKEEERLKQEKELATRQAKSDKVSKEFEKLPDDLKNMDIGDLMNLQESIRRILREEVNIPSYIKRRLYLVDEYINNLDPEDVCRYWRDDESKDYVNESMAEITRDIINFSLNISDDEYTEKYDEVYGILIDLGYKEKFKDFFYESLQNCNPKHRMRFMKP